MRRTIGGEACVSALLRTGFGIRQRAHGLTILKRGARMVMVPDVDVLSPDMVDAILRSAGIEAKELEANLPFEPKRSGSFSRLQVEGHAADTSDAEPPSSTADTRRRR